MLLGKAKPFSLEEELEVARVRVEDAARRAVKTPERLYLVALGARLHELDDVKAALKRRRDAQSVGGRPSKDLVEA